MEKDKLDANYDKLNSFLRQMSKGYFNEYTTSPSSKTQPDPNPDHTKPDSENDHTEKQEESDHSEPENHVSKKRKHRSKKKK